ncbi:DUF4174 domain-containing protein [Rhodohalobacter sp. 8-1]|uniref:DUF4174 domain-containing protein n=1 Tax=Rhodohalobacter sp. 8-1 TaxID=3131972 RepID=UPI0030EB4559
MNQILLLTLLPFFIMAHIQAGDDKNEPDCPGKDISLNQFQWENRIIVMFAKHSKSESYQRQMNEFAFHSEELRDRDLVLISVFEGECATLENEIISDESANSIRSRLSPPDNSYSIFLIGKDGGVKLKQDEFLATDELFRVIDRMPMRQREMRDGG